MKPNEIVIQVSGDPRMVDRLSGWALTTGIPCPACGQGVLVWAENGYVPGYRICSYCGRGWDAHPEGDGVHIYIPEVSVGQYTRPEWKFPEVLTQDWMDNGDGADKARAHTWREHGGAGVIHGDDECLRYADPPLQKEQNPDKPDPEDPDLGKAYEIDRDFRPDDGDYGRAFQDDGGND